MLLHKKREELIMKKQSRTCPICGKIYTDYPALSRTDNYTDICPQCGINEAMEKYTNKVFLPKH
jgi:RNA polymerase subunit RPABC4/transcription elongation factor Spt4